MSLHPLFATILRDFGAPVEATMNPIGVTVSPLDTRSRVLREALDYLAERADDLSTACLVQLDEDLRGWDAVAYNVEYHSRLSETGYGHRDRLIRALRVLADRSARFAPGALERLAITAAKVLGPYAQHGEPGDRNAESAIVTRIAAALEGRGYPRAGVAR